MEMGYSVDRSCYLLSLECTLPNKGVTVKCEEGVLTVIGQVAGSRKFRRCIRMPKCIDSAKITATIQNGLVLIVLPFLAKVLGLPSPSDQSEAEQMPLLRTRTPPSSPMNTPPNSPPSSPTTRRKLTNWTAVQLPSPLLVETYYPRYGALRTELGVAVRVST